VGDEPRRYIDEQCAHRELVPRADVTLLDGIGHYPQIEAPAAVLEAYAAFRGRVGVAGLGVISNGRKSEGTEGNGRS
jgi:hypothetical protein